MHLCFAAAAEGVGDDEEDGELIMEPEPGVVAGGDLESTEPSGPISRALALQLQTESSVLGTSDGGGKSDITPLVRKGGRWAYCIGLVGKPSAGKSTFFNAVAGSELAKVGATPFTTIDPNVHQAIINVEGPTVNGVTKVHCPVPVTVKDVAGLVPGACDGLGKGNRFLNDLCDADVLVHIIDASGKTDERGNANEVGGHEIVHDVTCAFALNLFLCNLSHLRVQFGHSCLHGTRLLLLHLTVGAVLHALQGYTTSFSGGSTTIFLINKLAGSANQSICTICSRDIRRSTG
jgi:hypothetical protein|eukprot:COSAG02_NODE_2289_length_9209_cov_3.304720_6_plen_291_part_00